MESFVIVLQDVLHYSYLGKKWNLSYSPIAFGWYPSLAIFFYQVQNINVSLFYIRPYVPAPICLFLQQSLDRTLHMLGAS